MKLFVTGAGGQLGMELIRLELPPHIQIFGAGRDQLDITNAEQCRQVLAAYAPDAVIHCAAYTAVDKAESESDAAFLVNQEGTRNIALAAVACGAKLCYISTDYVFDGKASEPYEEHDPVHPQTVYGKSKLAGEQAVQEILDRFFIVRTSWVFGRYGNNFVRTIVKLAGERSELQVVSDQIGSPTYTLDLARFLVELVQSEHYGIYHASNQGICSWYDFAQEILNESGMHAVKLVPCATSAFPRPAARPAYSVMSHAMIKRNGLTDLRPWQEALHNYLNDKA
ncbi:dTDP-4-dehydrorhamnose reductase [Paenibacillus sp. OV219]|uniref:dTDP-4-dehydrorhamnose reductase n=1 Tax=Paenibacillus sp. OV219 TaxID=1884377 RepID=UPI0008D8BA3F|nr:dTDP-4-dehydrorhamnose reductase [Paenibacillus sp. OV219]SEP03240.1 dTDP-4-dehydrorhamnose reductase [Paenibacillus sp. OV219]